MRLRVWPSSGTNATAKSTLYWFFIPNKWNVVDQILIWRVRNLNRGRVNVNTYRFIQALYETARIIRFRSNDVLFQLHNIEGEIEFQCEKIQHFEGDTFADGLPVLHFYIAQWEILQFLVFFLFGFHYKMFFFILICSNNTGTKYVHSTLSHLALFHSIFPSISVTFQLN